MRFLLLHNDRSRRGGEPLDDALSVIRGVGHTVEVEPIPPADRIGILLEGRRDSFDAVIVAGGDGTVHDAAPALLACGKPVGILPRGTANDLARSIGLPLDVRAAAGVIADARRRRIDVGEVNGMPFFNVAHIGLGAALEQQLSPGMKRRLGPLAYGAAAASALWRLKPFRVHLKEGSRTVELTCYGVTVGNGRYFGGSGVVAEDAQIDDNRLHLFALTAKNPLRLIMLIPGMLRGTQERSSIIEALSAEAFEIRTRKPMRIRADGNFVSRTPAAFRVMPRALEVFAPSRDRPGRT